MRPEVGRRPASSRGPSGLRARHEDRQDTMGRILIPRHHVGLSYTHLTDTERHGLIAGIKQVAPASELVKNDPALQASLAALILSDAGLTQANETVDKDRQTLRTDIAAEAKAR